MDVTTGTKLARAFSTYFHLANITEQVHRVAGPAPPTGDARRLAGPGGQADRRARGAGRGDRRRCPPAGRPAGFHRPPHRGGPPVDPVQAARRRRRTGRRGAGRDPYGASDEGPANRRLAELLDLLWQTDELRLDRPDPTDEARNAIYYLRDLYAEAAPQVLDELADTLAPSGSRPAPTARPLTFGTWIGGDRDGNPFVTPHVTREVLLIQYEHGIQATEAAMEALISEVSVSRPAPRGVAGPVGQPRRRPGRAARGPGPVPSGQR